MRRSHHNPSPFRISSTNLNQQTKLQELLYLHSQLSSSGAARVTVVDVGRKPVSHESITVSQTTLTQDYAPSERKDVSTLDRGEVIKYMTACASHWVRIVQISYSLRKSTPVNIAPSSLRPTKQVSQILPKPSMVSSPLEEPAGLPWPLP